MRFWSEIGFPGYVSFQWEHISFTSDGNVPDNFNRSPDWIIEILSLEQRPNQVLDNILYCLENSSRVGWFIDSDDLNILFLHLHSAG
ncbi:hypothetical protein C1752_01565 [Acaryochloris thomasi RCC1774]|uniref:Putative restriction endonuclease domain-containing protein n=1 Tax=Acaryochloris thomasi RCC1774 TaxID=1764569 RepID=A0A2W1JKY4_9CYAN|nr:hypothetical protein C1752_01565 [Acaryochloris thomasi RCC1774]